MKISKEVKDVLKPFGSLDLLYYYSIVAEKLKNFLKGKEIATKTMLPKGIPFFLKRGSNTEPLFIEDFSAVDEKMLKLRAEGDLDSAREQLSKKQQLIWEYFVPRKLIHFFYATNNEGQGKPIERVFIDIDKGKNVKSEDAQRVAKLLVELIQNDKEFNKLLKYKTFVMWTGASFHIYLLLQKKINLEFYNKYLAFSKNAPLESFTGRWADHINKVSGMKVKGGHEKTKDYVVIDPSCTPSGKLARVPFSIHTKSASEIDGYAVPLQEDELRNKNLISELKKLSAEKILENLDNYARLL